MLVRSHLSTLAAHPWLRQEPYWLEMHLRDSKYVRWTENTKTPFTTSYTGQSGVLASQNPLSEKFPEISEMFWQEQGNSSCELLTMTMLPLQSVRSIQPQHSIYRWGELSTGFICNSQRFTPKDVWLARLMKGLTHIILYSFWNSYFGPDFMFFNLTPM